MSKGEVIKLSVNLSEDVVDALRELAKSRNVTMTEVIRDAIGTEKFLEDARQKHEKILIEDEKGQVRQLVFR